MDKLETGPCFRPFEEKEECCFLGVLTRDTSLVTVHSETLTHGAQKSSFC